MPRVLAEFFLNQFIFVRNEFLLRKTYEGMLISRPGPCYDV